MTCVISSPSISTMVPFTLIFANWASSEGRTKRRALYHRCRAAESWRLRLAARMALGRLCARRALRSASARALLTPWRRPIGCAEPAQRGGFDLIRVAVNSGEPRVAGTSLTVGALVRACHDATIAQALATLAIEGLDRAAL